MTTAPAAPKRITDRLWRWTVPHPEWRPAKSGSAEDWEREVGCVLHLGNASAVFFDPMLPANPEPFWTWADERIGERAVFVLNTIKYHRRDRDAFAERYRASTSRAKPKLPAGVEAFAARGAGETLFWVPAERALIPGDRILGAEGGGLRLCPESWLGSQPVDRAGLAALLRPLLELPIERVLVSHGEPVLSGGLAALRGAIDSAA